MPNWQESEYRSSSLDAITLLHLDSGIAVEQNIDTRTKLDEPYTLAASYVISNL
jgi:hypothetical protein